MHRDHWIPADDRTKVFWLFGCSLTPLASGLSPASESLISIESSVGFRGLHTQKDDGLGLSSEFTFPLV